MGEVRSRVCIRVDSGGNSVRIKAARTRPHQLPCGMQRYKVVKPADDETKPFFSDPDKAWARNSWRGRSSCLPVWDSAHLKDFKSHKKFLHDLLACLSAAWVSVTKFIFNVLWDGSNSDEMLWQSTYPEVVPPPRIWSYLQPPVSKVTDVYPAAYMSISLILTETFLFLQPPWYTKLTVTCVISLQCHTFWEINLWEISYLT